MGLSTPIGIETRTCEICNERFLANGTDDRKICRKCEREAVERAGKAKLGSMER